MHPLTVSTTSTTREAGRRPDILSLPATVVHRGPRLVADQIRGPGPQAHRRTDHRLLRCGRAVGHRSARQRNRTPRRRGGDTQRAWLRGRGPAVPALAGRPGGAGCHRADDRHLGPGLPAPAAIDLPRQIPPASSILALATLGIVNTGIAYWLFYLLIDEAGGGYASVSTYVTPVVALFLGVGLLAERLTIGAIAGLILIAVGAWLATRQRAAPSRQDPSGRCARPVPPAPRWLSRSDDRPARPPGARTPR